MATHVAVTSAAGGLLRTGVPAKSNRVDGVAVEAQRARELANDTEETSEGSSGRVGGLKRYVQEVDAI